MEFFHYFKAFYVFYIGICHKPASKGINIDVELNFCFGHNREWNLGAGLSESNKGIRLQYIQDISVA